MFAVFLQAPCSPGRAPKEPNLALHGLLYRYRWWHQSRPRHFAASRAEQDVKLDCVKAFAYFGLP